MHAHKMVLLHIKKSGFIQAIQETQTYGAPLIRSQSLE